MIYHFLVLKFTFPVKTRPVIFGMMLAAARLNVLVVPLMSANVMSGVLNAASKLVIVVASPPLVLIVSVAVGVTKSTNSPSVESIRVMLSAPPESVRLIVSAAPVNVNTRLATTMLSVIGSKPV